MAILELSPQDSIYYEYAAPTSSDGCTFVFFNALTGSTDMWNAAISPQLQEAGHGTLLFNFRGQSNTSFAPGTRLNPQLISDDAQKLLKETTPPKPVFVGLSIGGLFAAYTYLNGSDAAGLIFLNTLRRDGARLRWINDATVLYAKVGGMDLLKDCMFPLLFDEEWLEALEPLRLEYSRIWLPPPKTHFFSTDWRARYVFEFLLPPAEEILRWRLERGSRKSHPVDAGVTLDQVERQLAVYREAALYFHRSGLLTYVREEIEGMPKSIKIAAQQAG